jgi:cysteine dioxygenase
MGALNGARAIETIDQLTSAIDRVLKEHPNPSPHRDTLLQNILRDIQFSPSVLNKFIHWDNSKPYTRNRIKFLAGQYELLVLCWNPGKGSKIHDHPGDGCYVRMLQGRLAETIFRITDATTNTMEIIKSSEVRDGDVTYINDGIGVHRLANPDPTIGAVSLHLYTPPALKCTASYTFTSCSCKFCFVNWTFSALIRY